MPLAAVYRIVNAQKSAGWDCPGETDGSMLSCAGLDRRRVCGSRCRRRDGAGADRLSRPSGENHRSDRPRRQLRPGRAPCCRCAVEADRTGLLCREQARRRHRRRHGSRGAKRGGWLYARGRRALQHGVQFRAVFEARLRSAEGFCAGRAGLQVRLRDGSAQGFASDDAAGNRRGGKGKLRLDHGCDRRRRHRPATGGRRIHEGRGDQTAGSTLQGLAPGVHRSAGGPGRPVLRLDRRRAALCAIGAGEGHRRAVVEAQRAGAGCADHVGGRRARARCRFLARHLCAGENPAGGDREITP